MMMEAAQDDVENRPAAQGEDHDELHQGKAATGLLRTGLRVLLQVGGRVGQLRRGAVHDLDGPALELRAGTDPAIGGLGGGLDGFFQPLLGEAQAGLDVGRIAFRDRRPALQRAQGLDLADHLAAGGPGFEHLPQKAFERQARREVALPAVGSLLLAGQERGGQQVADLVLELAQGGLAQGVDGAPAHSGQAGAEGGKEGSVHRAVYLPPY